MTDVPNPKLTWLRELLASAQAAANATPTLESPTKAIGPGTAWTGTRADQVHDNLLAPNAGPFQHALNELVNDILKVIGNTPKTVPASQVHMMELVHAGRI
ncbi:hypothetical protein [uncultured Jatrophihabitans sp.]|uniref:hypothetical protein n=1 Tax=uncultured Jatrophihabitans sp. TaxID=1610747 RepID=UPI0035CC3CB8